jgi:hypothetical protein
MRSSGRLILWSVLCLALLAAGAITRLGELLAARMRTAAPRRARLLALALVIPALLALVEGVPDRLYMTPPRIPPSLERAFAEREDPLLVLPVGPWENFPVILWSTQGFPKIANGNSGHFPPEYFKIEAAGKEFPSAASIATLRRFGIRTVVVVRATSMGTPFEHALTAQPEASGVRRDSYDDAVVFTL